MFFGQNRIFSYLIGIDGIDLNLEAAFSVSGDRVILRNLPLYVAPYVGPNRALAFLRDLLRLPSFGDDERIPDEDGNIEFTPLSFASFESSKILSTSRCHLGLTLSGHSLVPEQGLIAPPET